MINHSKKAILLIAAAFLSFNVAATDRYSKTKDFRVTITNLTKGIIFTPFLAATHNSNVGLFELGDTASDEIAAVAEGGDISGLDAQLSASSDVYATANTGGLLEPGQSITIDISTKRGFRYLSAVAMLLPTNDAMAALRGGRLPSRGKVTYLMTAYDAGSETNDELCANIPGPQCGGTPFSPEDEGEGYIYPSPGIHGEADLANSEYQWDGAVAKIEIEAIR